jgi:hypothetical protein
MICMEAMHFYDFHVGEKQVNLVLTGRNRDELINAVGQLGNQPSIISIIKTGDTFKVEASVMVKKKDFPKAILEKADTLTGVNLETIE